MHIMSLSFFFVFFKNAQLSKTHTRSVSYFCKSFIICLFRLCAQADICSGVATESERLKCKAACSRER